MSKLLSGKALVVQIGEFETRVAGMTLGMKLPQVQETAVLETPAGAVAGPVLAPGPAGAVLPLFAGLLGAGSLARLEARSAVPPLAFVVCLGLAGFRHRGGLRSSGGAGGCPLWPVALCLAPCAARFFCCPGPPSVAALRLFFVSAPGTFFFSRLRRFMRCGLRPRASVNRGDQSAHTGTTATHPPAADRSRQERARVQSCGPGGPLRGHRSRISNQQHGQTRRPAQS